MRKPFWPDSKRHAGERFTLEAQIGTLHTQRLCSRERDLVASGLAMDAAHVALRAISMRVSANVAQGMPCVLLRISFRLCIKQFAQVKCLILLTAPTHVTRGTPSVLPRISLRISLEQFVQ